MTIIVRLVLLIIMLSSWNVALANSLDEQINHLISQQFTHSIDNIAITYTKPKPKLSCESPILTILNKKKRWGNLTVSAQCGNEKKFIQINAAVSGEYIVANQNISAGTVITEQHISIKSGRLDTLTSTVILDKQQAINRIALRNINRDEPIKTVILQKNWYVKAGQIVKVIVNGEGYQIFTNGKTLNNAILDDHINVRLNSGNVIEGTVTTQGIVFFNK